MKFSWLHIFPFTLFPFVVISHSHLASTHNSSAIWSVDHFFRGKVCVCANCKGAFIHFCYITLCRSYDRIELHHHFTKFQFFVIRAYYFIVSFHSEVHWQDNNTNKIRNMKKQQHHSSRTYSWTICTEHKYKLFCVCVVSKLRVWNIACAQIYDMSVHILFGWCAGDTKPGKLTIIAMVLGICAASMVWARMHAHRDSKARTNIHTIATTNTSNTQP